MGIREFGEYQKKYTQDKVSKIINLKKYLIDIPLELEIKNYQKMNIKPRISFFPFGENRKKIKREIEKYEKGLKKIQENYQNHPLIRKLSDIQNECTHDYGEWEKIDNSSERTLLFKIFSIYPLKFEKRCQNCSHEQYKHLTI